MPMGQQQDCGLSRTGIMRPEKSVYPDEQQQAGENVYEF